jgi:uridine monophosphate synthetase
MKKLLSFSFIIYALFFSALSCTKPKYYTNEEKELIIQLYEIGVLRFDTSTMNLPLTSPYYIDLRHVMSYPEIFKKIVLLFAKKTQALSFDTLCGVPYAALALASSVAYEIEKPLIMRRSHVKNYGTGRKIEGIVKAGNNCL